MSAAADQPCVVVVESGDSLSLIADSIPDPAATVAGIQAENGISNADVIEPGQRLDVCVGNGVDDVTGASTEAGGRTQPTPAVSRRSNASSTSCSPGVGIAELAVDGDSGPLTRQQLCAFRLARNLPISPRRHGAGQRGGAAAHGDDDAADPAGGGHRRGSLDPDRQDVPGDVRRRAEHPHRVRVRHVDRRDRDTKPTTRSPCGRSATTRHSTTGAGTTAATFPVAADNPLNGNMYRPLYFFRGEAIHGANNVPPQPKSKGCARLRVENQDALIAWLGLGDASGPIWNRDRINLTVTVARRVRARSCRVASRFEACSRRRT